MATYTKANNNTALNVTSSWSPATVPTAADIGLFSSTYAQTGTIPLGGALAFGGIQVTTYTSGANPITIGTTTANWTIGSSSIDLSTAARNLTISSPITVLMSTNQTWNVNTGRTLTIGSVLSETGGSRTLTKTGAGTVTLTNANTYTGATTVSAGTLRLERTAVSSSAAYATAIQNNSAIVCLASNNSGIVITKPISGSGTWTIDGPGGGGTFDNRIIFAPNSTPTNTGSFSVVNGGKLWLEGGNNGVASSTDVTLAASALLTFYGSAQYTIGGLNGSGTVDIVTLDGGLPSFAFGGGNKSGSFSGILKNTVGSLVVTKTGTGTQTLTGRNTYSGGTVINAGILQLGNGQGASGGVIRGSLTLNNSGSEVNLIDADSFGADNGAWATSLTTLTANSGTVIRLSTSNSSFLGGTYTLNNASVIGTASTSLLTFHDFNSASTRLILASTGTSSITKGVGSGVINLYQDITQFNVSSGTLTVDMPMNPDVAAREPNAAVSKTGAGTLVLTGASTYIGGFTLSAGTVNLGVAQVGSTSGPLGASGTITLGGGTLQYSAANQHDYSSRFSTAASQQYRCDTNGQSVTWASNLTSSGGVLAKSGAGTLTLVGTNTYSNGATLSAGGLTLGSDSALGTGTFTISGGAVDVLGARSITNALSIGSSFTFTGSDTLTQSTGGIALTTSPTITVSASTLTLGGVVSGSFALTKAGAGTLTLSGANTYNGLSGTVPGTTISEGTLNVGSIQSSTSVGPLGALFPNSLVFDGGVLQYSAANTYDYSPYVKYVLGKGIRVDTNGQNVIWSVSLLNISPTVGTPGLEKIGSGKWTIWSTVVNSGATSITGGTLEIGSPGSLNGTYSGNIAFSNSAILAYTSSVDQTLSGTISGAGSITKSNASTLTITQANTYSGGTTLSAGTLTLGSVTALGTGSFTISGGTLDITTNLLNVDNPFLMTGSFTYAGTGGSGSLTLSSSGGLTVSSAATLTVNSGAIFRSGVTFTNRLTKSGSGNLQLAAGSGSGGFTLLAGAALVNSSSTPFGTGSIVISGGALGATTTARSFQNDMVIAASFAFQGPTSLTQTVGNITLTISGIVINVFNADLALGGTISGAYGFSKTGAQKLVLSGDNTYSGGTNIAAGTIAAGYGNALGTGTVGVASGATLQALASIGGKLNIGGNLTNSGGTLRIGGS